MPPTFFLNMSVYFRSKKFRLVIEFEEIDKEGINHSNVHENILVHHHIKLYSKVV